MGAEREAGRRGGLEARRADNWVRPADGPRVTVGRGRPGCGARLPACLGPGRASPRRGTPPWPRPSRLRTPRPSRCPRPPNPSGPSSPVHLPFRPCAPTPPPGRTLAQPYLLRTQHQIRLAPSAPNPSLFVVCTPVTSILFIHSTTLPRTSSSTSSLGHHPPTPSPSRGFLPPALIIPTPAPLSPRPPVLARPLSFVASAAVPSALFILLPQTPAQNPFSL